MSHFQLTVNGVRELADLTGTMHKIDVVVKCYFPDIPYAIATEYPVGLHADIWDGNESLPVIFTTQFYNWQREMWSIYHYDICMTIRITRAMFSLRGHGVLLIQNSELLLREDARLIPRPLEMNFFEPNKTSISLQHHPIASIPFFDQEDIPPIRVLVTYKSLLRDKYYKYGVLVGNAFVVHLLDESTEVRALVRDQIALELYDKFEEGKMYYIENYSFGLPEYNHRYFHNVQESEWIVEIRNFTYIKKCSTLSDKQSKLTLRFRVAPLRAISKIRGKHYYDLVGIVRDVGPLEEKNGLHTTESGIMVPYRVITLIDRSEYVLKVTLWTYHAIEFKEKSGTIVGFRNVEIIGDTDSPVSVLTTSTMHVEPNMEYRRTLRRWLNNDHGGDVFNVQTAEKKV